jgi:PII-like signaling protein
VSVDGLKLTVYFGERARLEGDLLADRLLGLFGDHRLAAGILIRGVEGFGLKHHARTDRLLTLSEDLPMVAVAVDRPERVEAALKEIEALIFDGLITLERARMLDRAATTSGSSVAGEDNQVKLTIYLGRGERHEGRPAYERVVELLHHHGVAGATVLLGVDGTIAGERRRAGFFSRNTEVPLMIVSVGSGAQIAPVLPELGALAAEQVATVERVRVLKRDGQLLGRLDDLPVDGPSDLDRRIKLTLYSGEQNHYRGRPVHIAAVRGLREAGATGATALRGVWGYHGDHRPHGDTMRTLRRRVPTVTVVIDRPESARRWFELLDRWTPQRGLITGEIVAAIRGPELRAVRR